MLLVAPGARPADRNRGVHGHRPIDLPGGVGLGQQDGVDPVPVGDALHDLAVVPERAAALAVGAGQQRLNAGLLSRLGEKTLSRGWL